MSSGQVDSTRPSGDVGVLKNTESPPGAVTSTADTP
jgi:hypothetical protein